MAGVVALRVYYRTLTEQLKEDRFFRLYGTFIRIICPSSVAKDVLTKGYSMIERDLPISSPDAFLLLLLSTCNIGFKRLFN